MHKNERVRLKNALREFNIINATLLAIQTFPETIINF